MSKVKIEISVKSVLKVIGIFIGLWFVFYIRDILIQLLVALLIMIILNPLVTRLSRFRIPRALSVSIVYIVVFGLLGFALASILPALVEQSASFANSLPKYLEDLNIPQVVTDGVAREFTAFLGNLPSQALKFSVSVFNNALAVLAVLVFAFYLLLARDKIYSRLEMVFVEEKAKKIANALAMLEARLGGWARGQLILMVVVGLANYIGLSLLGIPFALPLAVLHGLLEIVPNIGPFLGAIPSVIVGFGISPVAGLAVTALAFLVQQTENYVLVPKVMEKSVGISPIVTLLALLIGARLAGVAGVILSVPTVITLHVLFKEFVVPRKI